MWSDVWGLDMSPLVGAAKEGFLVDPNFEVQIEPTQLLASGEAVIRVDICGVFAVYARVRREPQLSIHNGDVRAASS